MKNPVCYIANKEIDGGIASRFGWNPSMGGKGWNPYKIASLRGLYDEWALDHGQDILDVSDLDKAAETLMKFRIANNKAARARIANSSKRIDRAYDALRHLYSLHQRQDRISFISALFSYEVDRLIGNYPEVSRQAVVNGFATTTGDYIGGSAAILEGVYNNLLEQRANYYKQMQYPEQCFRIARGLDPNTGKKVEGKENKLNFKDAPTTAEEYRQMCEHRYEEYTKMLENWTEFIPFVLKDLVQKEGVKIGVKKEYAAAASSDSFGDNDIAAKWEISESVRDGWQQNSDLQSSFGSVGQQVRRILATVPEVEQVPIFKDVTNPDGSVTRVVDRFQYQTVRDDLGNVKFKDPVRTHQFLMEYLRGVQSSEDMMNRLCKPGNMGEAKVAWMQPLVNILQSSNLARTQFFCDFKKNFQPYSVMYEEEKQGSFLKKIKTRLLNKSTNILLGRYEMTISPRGSYSPNVKLWGYEPVFKEGGEVNWKRLSELRQKVLEWTDTGVTKNSDGSPNLAGFHPSLLTDRSNNATKKYDDKRAFLMEVFTSLGFDVEVDTVDRILQSNDLYTIQNQLEQLFDRNGNSGLLYALTGDEPSAFRTLSSNKSQQEKDAALEKLSNMHKQYRNLYSKTKGGSKKGMVAEHTEKLLDVIYKYQEGFRLESRCRYGDNTMYSNVAPSYLGDRLEAMQSYVENDDKKGLLTFLTNEYLQSPFFVDTEYLSSNGESGRILNTWLREMVEACNTPNIPLKNSVASIFTYERDLGKVDKKFEDFTSKEHGLDMFIHFFADEGQSKGYGGTGTKNINKKLSALYPIFILGDAGVSKYIRAPRYSTPSYVDKKTGEVIDPANLSQHNNWKVKHVFDTRAEDKILDSFYDVYLQELSRMAIEDNINLRMYANGKEVKRNKGEFSMLTFLNSNSQEYNEKYSLPIDPKTGNYTTDETIVKNIIRQYLDDAAVNGMEHEDNGRTVKIPSFKQRLETLGVLETAEVTEGNKKSTVYKNLVDVATPQNIDAKVREFYWNTKLATIEQLQLMTIDPSFYHGTKDLQKRYKEIHAPGTILDLSARDFDGNLYSEDGIERVIYFDDISVNAEKTNPEFMETILRIFAEKGKEEEVEEAIKNGIASPKEDKGEESARLDKIKDLLGSNYSIYDSYRGNTLTDGQGYRTLDSYRKVMGMAGRWTKEMDDAYKRIKEIGRAIANEGRDMADADELEEIQNLAIVFQPIKHYMFTHERYEIEVDKKERDLAGNYVTALDRNGKPLKQKAWHYIPVQHKYAEALIIPEVLPKGSKLRDLGLYMDAHNIDMAGSTKIAKVGCFGSANISSAKTSEELNSSLSTGYIHQLPYRDYRIQTNVPEHINSSQLFGTQVRKLIMASMPMGVNKSFYLGGRNSINLSTTDDENDASRHAEVNGRNILALYNSLICANILDSYETFANNAGDIEALSDMLQQSTVGALRESMDNIFSYVVTGNEAGLQKFLIPLFEGGLEHDAAALILSTFKKIVNKQQICGGSAVQVSAFGIKGYEEDGDLRFVQDPENDKNILYAECEMPFDKSFMVDVKLKDGTKTKQKVKLSFSKYCYDEGENYGVPRPSGEAIPKMINGKINPEWKKYQSFTYKEVNGNLEACSYKDPQAQVYKPLIEQDYPDILSILAYRIPTERDYSMLNLMVKRFTSKTAGGTLKVPPQGTTIAGFDFDIDKLYFMVREYHKHYKDESYTESHFTNGQKNNIWAEFYDNNPEIRAALEEARAEAEAKNPDLVKTTETVIGGKTRVRTEHLTTLNSYWEAAGIEDTFGQNKRNAFAETAQQMDIKPTVDVHGDMTEWMEEYDFDKSPEENSRASRNNLLITLIQQRLMDPETVKQRYTPGGFANASKAARFMRELFHGDLSNAVIMSGNTITDVNVAELEGRQDKNTDPEPDYDPTDPYTMIVYNQQNQVAGKLIGIFANQNTNHAFCSALDVFKLNVSIDFCGKKNMEDLLHKDDEMTSEIDLNMAEFLAASVDAVKDPVLNFLNLNTLTADAGALLARLGYNTKEIGLLFNQPIIRKICEDSFNTGKRLTTAIEDAQTELLTHLTGVDQTRKPDLSEKNLILGIVNERKMLEEGKSQEEFLTQNALMQNAVLDLFSQILTASQDVSNFVLNTKFTASNAVSSTLGGLYAQQYKVDGYLDRFPEDDKNQGNLSYKMVVAKGAKGTGLMSRPIENDSKYLTMSKKEYLRQVRYNPFAYEQAMFDANRKVLRLLAKYFPYEQPMYSDIRGRMQELALYGTLSEDDINAIHSNIPVALLAKQRGTLFDGEAMHKEGGKPTPYTNREYYRNEFGKHLADVLAEHPEYRDLEIFKFLYPTPYTIVNPKTKEETEVWKLSIQDVGGLDSTTKELIKESWASLMEVDEDGFFLDGDAADLGRDLFMYCFYQLGFDFSPLSFMHLAPTQVKDFVNVGRTESIPVRTFDSVVPETQGHPTDDVLVYLGRDNLISQRATAEFGGYSSVTDELTGMAFQLSTDNNDELTYATIYNLIGTAKSHPELKFKVDADFSEKEFQKFTECGDIPSNVYFKQETLEQFPDAVSNMSYGRERTYREFLNEILTGENAGLNTDEFCQMFILNHLDNSRFVMDTSRGDAMRKFIKGQISKEGNTLKEGNEDRPYITIDVSDPSLSKDVLDRFAAISVTNGKITKAVWVPCIKINNSYYMAESGNARFNENASAQMTYRKVVPWGTSKEFQYDNTSLKPQMMYKSSMDAEEERGEAENTPSPISPIPSADIQTNPDANEQHNDQGTTLPDTVRQILENQITQVYLEAYRNKNGEPMPEEDVAKLGNALKQSSAKDIIDTVDDLMKISQRGGAWTFDDQGNPTKLC